MNKIIRLTQFIFLLFTYRRDFNICAILLCKYEVWLLNEETDENKIVCINSNWTAHISPYGYVIGVHSRGGIQSLKRMTHRKVCEPLRKSGHGRQWTFQFLLFLKGRLLLSVVMEAAQLIAIVRLYEELYKYSK